VLSLDWLMTLQDRREPLDKLLDPLPENAEPSAPRALWEG